MTQTLRPRIIAEITKLEILNEVIIVTIGCQIASVDKFKRAGLPALSATIVAKGRLHSNICLVFESYNSNKFPKTVLLC